MRHPRLKPDYTDTYHHCYNRVAGDRHYLPFGTAEKAYFIKLIRQLSVLYTVEVIGYQVMGNHYHLIGRAPQAIPSAAETCRRYAAYHNGKQTLEPDSPQCQVIARRLRDVSWFMADLQQYFTTWFNRTRPCRRRGALWAGRFRNTVLESGLAIWDCWKYIEMNCVRAGLAATPADYRFGSFGAWAGSGQHPFAKVLEKHLLPVFRDLLHTETMEELNTELRREFARMQATDKKRLSEEIEAAIEEAGKPIAFTTRATRRVRYWVDGLVIGSDLFVKQTMLRARGPDCMKKRRLTHAVEVGLGGNRLTCFKQLRVISP